MEKSNMVVGRLCDCKLPQMDGTQTVYGEHCWVSKLHMEHLFHAILMPPHYRSL